MDIRQFVKKESISDSRSVETISDKRLRSEVQTSHTESTTNVVVDSLRPIHT